MPMSLRLLGAIAIAVQVALAAAPSAAQMDDALARQAFDAADSNRDGVVDEAEFASDAVTAFAGQDQNRDQAIEPDELDDSVDATLLDQIDDDGDGRISFDELMAQKMRQFREADRDGDAVLSLDEALEFNTAPQGEAQ